jgi:hypothetical protein
MTDPSVDVTQAGSTQYLGTLHAFAAFDWGEEVEIKEMFERASDALTLVGDPYVARLYQQLASRLHLDDWGHNIRRSIAVLEGIYEGVSDQAATYRTEALEIIVILLILTEIILAIFRH